MAETTFDDDGAMFLVEAYLIGAHLELERYRNNTLKKNIVDTHTYIFLQLHEVSNLLEDLECIAIYFENNNINHELHKTWKQARHHVRHDIRDKIIDVKRRRKRFDYLGIPKHLNSQVYFQDDGFLIAGKTIKLDSIEEYLVWADEISVEYVNWLKKYEANKPNEGNSDAPSPVDESYRKGPGFERKIY